MSRGQAVPLKGIPIQKHGTRGCYIQQQCRCALCKEANRLYYHERKAIEDQAAQELAPAPAPGFTHFYRDDNGNQRKRAYKRACPGVNGKPCRRGVNLKRDSKGGLCIQCRKALVFDGLVDARPARRHLRKLSRWKVGYKQVADSACVAFSVVAKIRSGQRKQIRASTARRILEVDVAAIADHATVKAAPTWKLIHRLYREGFTKIELARRLGYKGNAVQFGRERVLAKTARKVERFYNTIMVGS